MATSDAKPGAEFSPPKNEAALIPWLDKKREQGKPRTSELQMKLNLAFVLGQQWLVWDGQRKSFKKPGQRPNDPNAPIRVTVNKIGGIVERTAAKLTKQVPVPEARPVGDQDSDLDAAKVGTRILNHETGRLSWDTLLSNLYTAWVIPLGFSYLHVTWDPEAGKSVGEIEDEQVHEGEILVEPVPAFELRVDPNARCMSDAKWAIRSVSMTKEAIWEMYGKEVEGGDSGKTVADEVNDMIESQSGKADGDDSFTLVHQMWMLPTKAVPKGLVVTWAGKTILEKKKDFPFDHGQLPFIEFDLLPGIGQREGRTWVTDLIPIQTDYNDARSREAAIRRTLVPKILAPTGSIDPNRVGSRVEIITFNPTGQAPSFMLPDGRWMAQHETAMNRADSELGERSGQNDASSANVPSTMPAAAILALQEADDTKLALSAKLLARGIQQAGYQILMLAKQFWMEERVVRTWSEDNTLQVDHFTGADLEHGFDVHVSSESAMPRSKAARTQLAVDLWTQGIITDPKVYLDMLDMPGTDFIRDQMSLDARQALRENDKLREGIPQDVHTWDNHSAHMQVHNDFRKSVDYEELPEPIRAVIDGHIANHESLILQSMASPLPGTGPQVPGAADGSPVQAEGPAGAMYTNPQTGVPNDPLAVASGQAPSALEGSPIDKKMKNRAGIGGPGEQGEVPGASTDMQARRTGN